MDRHRSFLVRLAACTLTAVAGTSPASENALAPDVYAPAVTPVLLYAGSVGAAGEQWFAGVKVSGDTITARNKEGLSLTVRVKDDDTVTSTIAGTPSLPSEVPKALPNGGSAGGMKFGYEQVDPNLQQPYLRGNGWKLWDWSLEQAKGAKARYSPLMADSRIQAVWPMPKTKGSVFVVGTTDGGNTCFQAHPQDINRNLDDPEGKVVAVIGNGITGGGGGGRSSWVFEVTTKGRPLRAIPFRNQVLAMTQDDWGRLLVAGGGVFRTGGASSLGYVDGAGVFMANAEWTQRLFSAHVGRRTEDEKVGGAFWAVDLDSKSGVLAVAGWVEGPFVGTSGEARSGGGKDALLAVYRLWKPDDYVAAKEAEKAAKSNGGKSTSAGSSSPGQAPADSGAK